MALDKEYFIKDALNEINDEQDRLTKIRIREYIKGIIAQQTIVRKANSEIDRIKKELSELEVTPEFKKEELI